jgi:hypothetical protein
MVFTPAEIAAANAYERAAGKQTTVDERTGGRTVPEGILVDCH